MAIQIHTDQEIPEKTRKDLKRIAEDINSLVDGEDSWVILTVASYIMAKHIPVNMSKSEFLKVMDKLYVSYKNKEL